MGQKVFGPNFLHNSWCWSLTKFYGNVDSWLPVKDWIRIISYKQRQSIPGFKFWVRVASWRMHFECEGPYKDRTTKICVWVCLRACLWERAFHGHVIRVPLSASPATSLSSAVSDTVYMTTFSEFVDKQLSMQMTTYRKQSHTDNQNVAPRSSAVLRLNQSTPQ